MSKSTRKHGDAMSKVDRTKQYPLKAAVGVVKESSYAKFDETVDVAVRLGVDPRHADQMVRGAVVLPNGLGKDVRVLVLQRARRKKKRLMQVLTMLALKIWWQRFRKAGLTLIPR